MNLIEAAEHAPVMQRTAQWLAGSSASDVLWASDVESAFSALDLAFAAYLQGAMPSDDPCHAVLAALVSHQYGRGHACLDLASLTDDPARTLGWDASALAVLRGVAPAGWHAAAASLPWTQGQDSPLVLDGPRLYLRRNWAAEQLIRASIAERLSQAPLVTAGTDASNALREALDLLFPRSEGAPSPDWQKVACALAARQRFTLITGGPGTGKTTTVVRLLALLQAQARTQGRKPLRVALAAPTGKAAARLTESIASALSQLPPEWRPSLATQAQTLHKLLQIKPNAGGGLAAGPLAVDLVVVDEASMIDLEMMARLLQAVPVGASLILLGDKDQLASVEAGAVMGQLCDGAASGRYDAATVQWLHEVTGEDLRGWCGGASGGALAQQTVMLRFSRRFAGDSAIGRWAAAVNAGEESQVRALWAQAPGPAQGAAVSRLQAANAADPALLQAWRQGWQDWRQDLAQLGHAPCGDEQALQILQSLARYQVLCAVREGPWGVLALNQRVARALAFPAEGWYVGRPVMVTRNDYALKLMNGDVGLCLPHAQGLRVAFSDGAGGIRWAQPARLDAVETVFAMTVHKSQGSEFEHVCLVLPEQAAVLTRELLYTGITRAKSRLTLVAPALGVLGRAVATRVLRSGGLSA